MITAVSEKNAHLNMIGSAALFEGGKAIHHEETIPMKLAWHSNRNSTQGGDR
jgi:hypothetical protein